MTEPKLVYAEWLDAATTDLTWADPASDKDRACCAVEHCIALGILYYETQEAIAIAPAASLDDGSVLGPCVIPRGMITRLEFLTLDKLRAQFEA